MSNTNGGGPNSIVAGSTLPRNVEMFDNLDKPSQEEIRELYPDVDHEIYGWFINPSGMWEYM